MLVEVISDVSKVENSDGFCIVVWSLQYQPSGNEYYMRYGSGRRLDNWFLLNAISSLTPCAGCILNPRQTVTRAHGRSHTRLPGNSHELSSTLNTFKFCIRVEESHQLFTIYSPALPLPRVIVSNFPSSLTRNSTSHSMKNLAFHSSFRWKIIMLPILTTSLIHFSLKGWENVLFELRSEGFNLSMIAINNYGPIGPTVTFAVFSTVAFRASAGITGLRFPAKIVVTCAAIDTWIIARAFRTYEVNRQVFIGPPWLSSSQALW